MMAAIKVHQQTSPQAPVEDKPADKIESEFSQAVSQAEKELGIKPGEFNQFDPKHSFVLNRIVSQANAQRSIQQTEKAQIQQEINTFVAAAKQDPLTPKVDAAFNQYALKLGSSSPDGASKCMAIMAARDRFLSNQATTADTKILKAHWDYVRGEIAKAEKPAIQPVQKPEPPKTETPGQVQAQHKEPVNFGNLVGRTTDDKFAALKKAGYF